MCRDLICSSRKRRASPFRAIIWLQGEPFQSRKRVKTISSLPGRTKQAGGNLFGDHRKFTGLDNTSTLQTFVLVGGGLGGLVCWRFRFYRRRTLSAKSGAVSERVDAIASLRAPG